MAERSVWHIAEAKPIAKGGGSSCCRKRTRILWAPASALSRAPAFPTTLKLECGSPSLAVISARVIHTTAWLDAGGRMIDIFAPPRIDFSTKPGWGGNADEYPMPAI